MDRLPPPTASPSQLWAAALASLAKLQRQPTLTLPALIDSLAEIHGDRPALVSETASLSYRDLARRKHRFAHWAIAQGLGPGDTVCLMMANAPDYPALWLGLSQAGVIVALTNTNLRGAPLAHAIAASAARHIVVDHAHLQALDTVAGLPLTIWVHGGPAAAGSSARHLDPEAQPATPAPSRAHPVALLVYTSGTTGLPKAAHITHARILEWSYWFAAMMQAGPEDRLFDCLPLYHSTGGIAGLGAMLVAGGSVILRRRFSAGTFWADIAAERCTIFLYIGELCRYLANTPAHPAETTHHLRLCCGNGLRADVWSSFQARFRIPRILEFYASTEGNVSLYNVEARPGAIGRVPPVLRHRFPVALIACDPDTGAPLRDAGGSCIRVAPGEPGEAIGMILQHGAASFDGYTDAQATAAKILRSVFADGDTWFRTGDLMRQDSAGFYYFVDRLGDTFRWKGENVSTTQVADILAAYPGITGAVVYGVAIPGEEGRAGMAAITVTDDFDLDALPGFLAQNLPAYAVPIFLRLCDTLETTGTFKPVRTELARQGYQHAGDKVYRLQQGKFVLF